jgi:hypothetical protein
MRTSHKTSILLRLIAQQQWIDAHGSTRLGYVRHYGTAREAKHYGDGGEAIYAADVAELRRLENELRGAK